MSSSPRFLLHNKKGLKDCKTTKIIKMNHLLRTLTLVFLSAAAVTGRSAEPTYTIPVVTINTENGVPVVDKETKISATMDIAVPDGYVTLNNKKAKDISGVELTIRGRGNASWNLDKKPYKLKLESKTEILGMPKNKHFSLIAYAGNYVGSVAGMELARCTGQGWAPHSEPVEVVLNGEYIGRYFLVENIKIDKNRLNIAEQPDLNEDASILEGGWLVEIDNYTEDAQIVIQETENLKLRVTYKTPEVLSEMQESWLIGQFTSMNSAIYSQDTTGEAWAAMIDPVSVARYFIVRETLGDTDGYNGSFYLHKDLGENTKWTFGPMWDLVLDRKKDWVFNDHPSYSAVHWIEAIFNTDAFQTALIAQWDLFKNEIDNVYAYIDRLGELCEHADVANYERWPQYEKGDSKEQADRSKGIIRNNFEWIDKYVSAAGTDDIRLTEEYEPVRIVGNVCRVGYGEKVNVAIYSIDGKKVAEKDCKGGETIDLSAFGKGAFILRATAPSSRTATKKIVVR